MSKTHSTPSHTDDNVGRGIDFALVVLFFLGLGYVLDRIFDTRPVLMIVMVLLGIIGEIVRFYYAYAARMQKMEAERSERAMGRPR